MTILLALSHEYWNYRHDYNSWLPATGLNGQFISPFMVMVVIDVLGLASFILPFCFWFHPVCPLFLCYCGLALCVGLWEYVLGVGFTCPILPFPLFCCCPPFSIGFLSPFYSYYLFRWRPLKFYHASLTKC